MSRKLLLLVLLCQLGFSYAFSQKPAVVTGDEKGWYKIGQISASFNKESESIVVMGKDEFASIKLRVKDAPVTIERVQVFFEGGKVQEAEVKQPLKVGEETAEIRLYAENMEISKVVFTYKTVANDQGEKAQVELYGYKSHRDSSGSSESSDLKKDVQEGAEKTEAAIEQGAEKVKDNVNEGATKTESMLSDEKMETMTGPNGETIFIDNNKNYYWVDDEGTRRYVSPLDLKAKE
jgi:hypothetical protein